MGLERSTGDVQHARFTAPYALQRCIKWVCTGTCVGLVASWSGWASAQSKHPSQSAVICYGNYGSLVSTLQEYCQGDESCRVRKPANEDTGLSFFLQTERDLGKSTYRELPGAVVVVATAGPKWIIGVLRHRGMSESDLSSLSNVMASICEKGDVNAKAFAEMEFYSIESKFTGKCNAVVMCK
jgi:hypothetical protein